MNAWVANAIVIGILLTCVFAVVLGLLWRVGAWYVSPAASLTLDEGLSPGAHAPDIAAYAGEQEMHLYFTGRRTFVVFGTRGCEPCKQLLVAASSHPAIASMRKVYVGDYEETDLSPHVLHKWERYRFHDEIRTRQTWRAPVSPYFHVVDSDGKIIAKGIANTRRHLDRLLQIQPRGLTVANRTSGNGGSAR